MTTIVLRITTIFFQAFAPLEGERISDCGCSADDGGHPNVERCSPCAGADLMSMAELSAVTRQVRQLHPNRRSHPLMYADEAYVLSVRTARRLCSQKIHGCDYSSRA